MDTGVIILIVVVVLILIALLVLLPRMRAKAQEQKARRELESRRENVATENREHATVRSREAERAEQKAAQAQQEAERERAEARRLEGEADMHEKGLADDQLIEDHERDRFEPVAGTGGGADRDNDGVDDRNEQGRGRGDNLAVAGEEGTRGGEGAAAESPEYRKGRDDETDRRES